MKPIGRRRAPQPLSNAQLEHELARRAAAAVERAAQDEVDKRARRLRTVAVVCLTVGYAAGIVSGAIAWAPLFSL